MFSRKLLMAISSGGIGGYSPVPWSIDGMFLEDDLDMSGITTAAIDGKLGINGDKFYVLINATDTIHQINLGVAGEISSGTDSTLSKDYSAQETNARCFCLGNNDTKLYILGTGFIIYQYSVTGGNINTATYDGLFLDVSTQITGVPYGMEFDPTGNRLYILDTTQKKIFQYTFVGNPWVINQGTYDNKSLDITAADTTVYSFVIAGNEGSILVNGTADDLLKRYTLGTIADVSSGSLDSEYFKEIGLYSDNTFGLTGNSAGTKFYATVNANIYQFSVATNKTWSLANNLLVAKRGMQGFGSSYNSAVCAGGYNPGSGVLNTSEEFDGTNWSAGGTLGVVRYTGIGFGTLSAGVIGGGFSTAYIQTAETYNGTSWAATGNMLTARHYSGACGTQSAGLVIGGISSTDSPLSSSEEFNGSTWSSATGTLPAARGQHGLCGTQSAALVVGGGTAGPVYDGAVLSYNGTTFSTEANVGFNIRLSSVVGNVSEALSFGGSLGAETTQLSILFDSIAWTVGSSLIEAKTLISEAGSTSEALSFGGLGGGATTADLNITEIYG